MEKYCTGLMINNHKECRRQRINKKIMITREEPCLAKSSRVRNKRMNRISQLLICQICQSRSYMQATCIIIITVSTLRTNIITNSLLPSSWLSAPLSAIKISSPSSTLGFWNGSSPGIQSSRFYILKSKYALLFNLPFIENEISKITSGNGAF